jgi:isoprenylcysteine carboxyl methyltransferase (ICMT) family protein YpbQ
MSNYLTNIYQTLRDHTKYFDITGLLPLMLCTAEMTYEYEYIADTGRFWKILVIPVLQILENTGYTSIADIGRLGRIPVNQSFYVYIILKELNIIHTHTSLVLQILENSGRYWNTSIYQYLYQYCRYWKILVKY